MATKPKAILSTHDGRETSPITKASNVLFENGQTAQDILNDRQDAMISPVIENSSSMFKVGQGDSVDYSENVVDGAYESCVLKGNTKVNLIQESSSQDVILPYEFTEGQSVKVGDTKTSGKLGIMLKGQSLVNMVSNGSTQYEVGTSGLTLAKYTVKKEFIKPNTKYTLIFNVISYSGGKISVTFNGSSPIYDANRNGLHKCTVTFTSEQLSVLNGQVWFYKVTGETLGGKVQNIMFIEGDYTTKQVPYFDNIQSSKPTVVKTTGKNLFNINNSNHLGASNVITVSENKILGLSTSHPAFGIDNLDPTKTYTISFKMKVVTEGAGNSLAYSIASSKSLYPTDVKSRVYLRGNFTIGQEYKRTETFSGCTSLWLQQGHNIEYYDIQIEEGGSATTYEAYTTSMFTLPEEVVLRGIPGTDICDTLNLETGEYTQNVQEFILTGSESYADLAIGTWTDDYRAFLINIQNSPFNFQQYPKQALASTNCYVEGFNYDTQVTHAVNKEGVYIGNGSQPNYIGFRIKRSRLENYNNSPREWVKANNIRILLNIHPVTKKIDLSHSLETWDGLTHLDTEVKSGTLYPTLSHVNPSYPVILKPSTKYSIVANSYSNNHTNSTINFNLGGATASTTVGNRVTTITTPSTLTSEELVMSGRGNKLNHVMVIEGDVVGDEPYFEGICDCKSPILSNIGKNLLDVESVFKVDGNTVKEAKDGSVVLYKPSHNSYIFEPIKVKANTTYTISCEIEKIIDGGRPVYGIGGVTENKTAMSDSSGNLALFMRAGDQNSEGEYKFYNIQLEEGSTATSYEPYKSNILSCNGDKIELTEDMFEQGHCGYNPSVIGSTYDEFKSVATPSYQATRVRSKSLVKVKPNTTYFIKADSTKYNFGMQGFDNNKLSIGYDTHWQTDHVFTTPANMCYASLHIRKNNDGNLTPANVDYNCIQLSEVDKTIVLRSLPNGVCDTLNVETGEYVQRIGEVIKNNATGFILSTGGWENKTKVCTFESFKPEGMKVQNANNKPTLNCDKVPSNTFSTQWNNSKGIESITQHFQGGIVLSITRDKLLIQDVDGLNTYLQSNPLTIQYELATPIVTTIDIQGFPFSYENGHVILSSGSIEQSLTPKVEYSVATNRNGQIRSNQKMVERHQKQLDQLQAIILANLVNSQYNQTLTTLKYELSRV